jgi:predicted acetyltransferase
MAEFHTVPDGRGHGTGRDAVKVILLAHPGMWELSVMSLNVSAQRFWPKAIEAAQAEQLERMEQDGETIYRFRIG